MQLLQAVSGAAGVAAQYVAAHALAQTEVWQRQVPIAL